MRLSSYPKQSASFEVQANQSHQLQIGPMEQLIITVKGADGKPVTLPFVCYDDLDSSITSPALRFETGIAVTLPSGRYNCSSALEGNRPLQLRGGANIEIKACKRNEVTLIQDASLLVCGPRDRAIIVHNGDRKEHIPANEAIPVAVHSVFDIMISKDHWIPNVVIEHGVNRVNCD